MVSRAKVYPSPSLSVVVAMAAAVQAGSEEGEVQVDFGSGIRVSPGEVGDPWGHVASVEEVVTMSFEAELVFEGD